MIARTKFQSEDEKRAYVRECDADFEARLDEVMKNVCSRKDLHYVTLSGPTCSGKTTASRKLISEFKERGRDVKIISLDDFFRDRADLEAEAARENRGVDFDSERALDIPALKSFIDALHAGIPAPLPKFEFVAGKRVSVSEFMPEETDIILFEGIQAIYPVFTDLIKNIPCVSLMISVEDSLTVNGVTLSPRTVRLMRRLVRDYRFRGAAPEFSFLLWEGVTANEDKNILPFTDRAELHINSLLGYEACMLKPYLDPLMKNVPKTSPYREKAEELLRALDGIDDISADYLPENALYKEFI